MTALFVSTPFIAYSLNWNGKTVLAIFDRANKRFNLETGHPYASYLAFKTVVDKAMQPQQTKITRGHQICDWR